MHIAASNPRFLTAQDIPPHVADKEKEILRAQAKESGKPDAVIEKMVQGRFQKFITDTCLFDQPYVRDPQTTVRQVVESTIGRLGENVQIRRFVRFQLGEDFESSF